MRNSLARSPFWVSLMHFFLGYVYLQACFHSERCKKQNIAFALCGSVMQLNNAVSKSCEVLSDDILTSCEQSLWINGNG